MAKAGDIVGLECDGTLLGGVKMVLCTRFADMCARRETAVDWTDIEGVHDMRVASRRLRSIIKDFAPFIRQRDVRRLKKGVKAVADALGDVRDVDVEIAALEKLRDDAPEAVSNGIERLIAERRRQRAAARLLLSVAIGGEAITQLQGQFLSALDEIAESSRWRKSEGGASDCAVKDLTFRGAARIILRARWEELESLSTSLYDPLQSQPLHDMRIAAKRLRYAIELFSAPCWDATLDSFAKEIAEMQFALGELHDCDVWIEGLGARLQNGALSKSNGEMVTAAKIERQDRQAVVWLMRHFTDKRAKHYSAALARWHKWEAGEFPRQLLSTIEGERATPAAVDACRAKIPNLTKSRESTDKGA